MSLLDSIATYLGSTDGANLGLTVGSTSGIPIFKIPIPESAPDAAVCVLEYGGREAVRAMGGSLAAPVAERPRFQVTTRGPLSGAQTARALASSIHDKLDQIGDVTLSGVRFLNIIALQPPFWLDEDANARQSFVCNFEATKERG